MVTDNTGCEIGALVVGNGSELVITTFTGAALLLIVLMVGVEVEAGKRFCAVLAALGIAAFGDSLTGWVMWGIVCDKICPVSIPTPKLVDGMP